MNSHISALVLLAAMLAGCEKRVVGVHNDWAGGSRTPPRVEHAPTPPASKGLLDHVGDFLFGWTRVFKGKPKPQPDPHSGWDLSQPAFRTSPDTPKR